MEKNSPINSNTRMSVSGLLHRGEKLSVCIYLEENDKYLEIRMPDEEILSRNGYTDDDISSIIEYLKNNNDEIMKTAKGINPMKAFMG